MELERMSDFFTARVDGYDEHMLKEVKGCMECYQKMAQLVPADTKKLLDLGCGTGLELEEIFKIHPDIEVTGVDLTKAMLDQLLKKYPDKKITLINDNYFHYDFGKEQYDLAISFETMHHFSHEDKRILYTKILNCLKSSGKYIECDYMITSQEEEDFYYRENQRLRKELKLSEDEIYHYDTPCTIDNQIRLFHQAGFSKAEMILREENTTIIVADK